MMLFYMFGILQVKHHKAMWCNGRKYHIKKLDETKKTSDSGITAVFEVTNVSSRSDRHPEFSENRYYGYLEDIIDCDFKSFKIILFVVKWYRLRLNQRDPDRTVIEHANGFTMVNTRLLESRTSEPYVLPSQCEQVFYSEVPGRMGWSFVIRHDPRGRPVKYNIVEEDEEGFEEEGEVEDQHELDIDHVPEEDVEELVEPYDVGDIVHDEDDIDDDFIETDSDDDDHMAFNPYNVESGSDDTNVDLDGEDDHELN